MLRAFCVVVLIAVSASAHDLYLVPGPKGRICAGVGENFPASQNAVSADRLELFRVRRGADAADLKGTAARELFCAPGGKGAFIAEMVVHPRFIKLDAGDFNEYIHAEGFNQVIRAREQSGASGTPGRELYSRYAKLLLGALGASATRPLGHVLEIVPEQAPSALKPGEPLRVRVLFQGKPLADVQVAAMYAGANMKGHAFPLVTRTGSDGVATLALDRPGLWYARLIHMVPAGGDPDVDWRSFFATLTFEVPRQ